MLTEFLTFINDQRLRQPGDRTLLAVSGGLDSIVLAELFHRAGWTFALAHANFQLRGADSDADEAFVRERATHYAVPFFTERFQPRAHAKTYGISTQMAARQLRYAWFEQVRVENGYDALATAHHQTDSLETVLLNLTRGTGLAGLRGIPVRNGAVIRPLLFASRADLESFARTENLTWREDASNASDDYARNRIRHYVLPVLRELNPRLEGTFADTRERLAAADRLVRAEIERVRAEVLRWQGTVATVRWPPLLAQAEPDFLLSELLRPFGFEYALAKRIFAARAGQPGRRFESPTHTLTLDRDQFLLTPRRGEVPPEPLRIELGTEQIHLPDATLRISCHDRRGFHLPDDPAVACFDAGKLTFPLTLRRWVPGDAFCPMGLGGHRKKVSAFLVDRKVPRPLKARVWVLLSGEAIAWVVGMRLDERVRVSETTQRVLRVELTPHGE